MNALESCFNRLLDSVEGNEGLCTAYSRNENAGVVFDVARTDLDTERNALHLVLRILPSGGVITVVNLYAEFCGKLVAQSVSGVKNAFLVLCNGTDDDLCGSDRGGENESVIVAVSHNDRADHTGRNAPGCLVRVLDLIVACGVLDVESLCKTVAEVVSCTALKSNAVVHHGLYGVGLNSTRELLLLGLLTLDYGNSERLLIEIGINVEHTDGLLTRLFFGLVHSVTLLPEELGGAEERTGGLFPTNNVAPLVVELRQVAVGLNDILVVLAEKSLGGRTDDKSFGELVLSADGYDRALGSKARNVIGFLLQKRLGDEHRHIYVLVTELLELGVKDALDILPDRVSVGADDHTSLNARIVNQLRFLYNVGIPLGKICFH